MKPFEHASLLVPPCDLLFMHCNPAVARKRESQYEKHEAKVGSVDMTEITDLSGGSGEASKALTAFLYIALYGPFASFHAKSAAALLWYKRKLLVMQIDRLDLLVSAGFLRIPTARPMFCSLVFKPRAMTDHFVI